MRLVVPDGKLSLGALRSEKVLPWHRDRLAVVYVRQSTPQQVLDHQESTRLQYGLVERARALGWAADRVLVIDQDLGHSAASATDRLGFQRLVSEVSLDHVGLILGLEMSRLARSNTDWYQLLELCALFRTLIADLDGVYDPAQYNDRLLLGLKGTLSEAELHVLKQRMHQGRLNKARRGELTFALPIGYVWGPDGQIRFDPDEQAQAVVRLIFRKFTELGTLHGVLRYLADHQIQLGVRVREGPGKGELVWRRANRMTLQNLLKHPLYAGAYVYGRRQDDPRRRRPGQPRSGRVVSSPEAWLAFVPDRAPAYISRERYEANLAQLEANRARTASRGAVRTGRALLAGLVVCARCGPRLIVRYDGSPARPTYVCARRASDYGEPHCQQVPASGLDAFVSQHVLAALEPATLELSLAATERLEQERAELEQLWQQRRERAAFEADRAARQYHAVEPEHRLVARTLERQWEEKLAAQQQLEEAYHRFVREQPRTLSEAERSAIRRLATDIPALWAASTTTDTDRKELIRQVVERVVVEAERSSERVHVRIVWVGGGQTTGTISRPIRHVAQLSTYAALCEHVRTWTQAGLPAISIAERLNAAGYRPTRGQAFGLQAVRDLRRQLGFTRHRPCPRSRTELAPDEWWATALGRALGVPNHTLQHWIRCGWVRARQEPAGLRRWIIWADAAEQERLRRLHHRPTRDEARQHWLQRKETHHAPTA
jgi:DNA invertase Pin-like site-specific DNA recombinase